MAGMTRERSQLKPTKRRVIGGGKTGRKRQGELKKVLLSRSQKHLAEKFKQSNNSFYVKPPFPPYVFQTISKIPKLVAFKACSSDNSQNEIRLFSSV